MELENNPNIHTVTQLNNRVKSYIEQKYNNIYVEGEIASFQEYSSGHIYMIIKDSSSEISCVLFNSKKKQSFNFELGMQLIVQGKISIYPAKGKYQLIISNIYHSGIGLSIQKLDLLKAKLNSKGVFLDSRKKVIPRYPSKVGLITSLRGAVVFDVMKVFNNKAPNIALVINDTQIQGLNATSNIINSIVDFNEYNDEVDVILLCRGGGSTEDLMPFNDENVVMAIYNSNIPIISGIGHESDVTLSDLVSDFRASTPTAAAEIAIYDSNDTIQRIDKIHNKINIAVINKVNNLKSKIDFLKNKRGFVDLNFKISRYKIFIKHSKKEMLIYLNNKLSFYRNKINLFNNILENCNPNKVLDKGYAIIKSNDNKIISSGENISIGQKINIEMKKFNFISEIKDKVKDEAE